MSEWRESTLDEVLSFSNGKTSPERADDLPYPVYGSNGVIGFASRTNAEPNSLVIGRVGSYCGSLYFSKEKSWVTDNAIRANALNDNDAHFLYYLLLTLGLNHWRAGSGQPLLNQAILGSISVSIPKPDEQRAIARVLSALDDKIELNRQINRTLEEMAQAIFKSWFVDFDPVKAKMAAIENGEDPNRAAMRAISGKSDAELDALPRDQQDQLAATAALFPSALQDSPLGPIPEGWGDQTIEDIIDLSYGKALKKEDRTNGEYPVYGSGGVNGTHDKFLVQGPGIIVGRKGTVGSLHWEDKAFYPIDTVFFVQCKSDMSLSFAYYLLQTLGLSDMNTDAAVPGLNRKNVYRLEIPEFSDELVKAFTNIADGIRAKIRATNEETDSLINIRDALLPKLLSGELRTLNAKKQPEVIL